MKVMIVVALCLLAMPLSTLGAQPEPVAQRGISFSLPFHSVTDGIHRRSLADLFSPGLPVVLISKKDKCGAKTAEIFTYRYALPFPATHVVGTEECFGIRDDEGLFGRFRIAIVGADPAMITVVAPKEDKSPVPKPLESKARRLAKSAKSDPCIDVGGPSGIHKAIGDSPPEALRVQDRVLLTFQTIKDFPVDNGPAVLVINNQVFRLCGSCPYSPLFFTVKDKLYLTYAATVHCCGCGDLSFFVYDISGASPRLVYENPAFSD